MRNTARTRRWGLLAATVVATTSLTACGGAGNGGDAGSGQDTVIRVFAAASLTESFTSLAKTFESENPGTRVELSFGPSSGLAEQIANGSPADVFASASPKNMDSLSGKVSTPKDFATNSMEIAVPKADPGKIESFADLARPGVKVALCQAQVPCGATASQAIAKAELKITPVTQEVDVKSVLTKVTLGEVDAGIVYVTDVKAAGSKVRGVTIPAAQNASTTYPIATVEGTKAQQTATDFVDLVTSAQGEAVLAEAGFGKP
ncbi:MAG: molybdenum transporter, periplasmic molybdate-binding protein [Marmoricola sp.]|nr:molybdenum transporter, periplasmic molybdate-binding protein [Marmoricola sp.]